MVQQHKYAMDIVRMFGKPDLFVAARAISVCCYALSSTTLAILLYHQPCHVRTLSLQHQNAVGTLRLHVFLSPTPVLPCAQFSQRSDTRCWRVRPPPTDRTSFPFFSREATGTGERLIKERLLRDCCRNMEGVGRKTFAMVNVCRVLPVVPSVVSTVFTGDIFVENPVICFLSIVCHKHPLDPLRPWFVSFALLTAPNVRICPYPRHYHCC